MNVPAALPTTDIATILIRIGLIIICAFLVSRLAAIAIGRIERVIRAGTQGFAIEREKRAKTVGQILRSVTWIVLVLVASLMAIR